MKEKYYYLKIEGHAPVTLFRNKKKEKTNQPDYKSTGGGIAMWVREYDADKNKEEDVEGD